MSFYRIMVLGVTFFMVGLCARLRMALAVFILGIAIYSFLWLWELCGRKKR